MRKKVFCMIAALFTMVAGMYAQTDEPATSGTCGECTWSYDSENKVLTISPTAAGGRMEDYTDFEELAESGVSGLNRPWESFAQEVEKLVIEEGVTHIGQASLALMGTKDSIIIPNSVETIGKGAFYFNIYVREKIVIGEGVTSIGDMAFYVCPAAAITVGSNVKNVGMGAFTFYNTTMTCLGKPFETWLNPPLPEDTNNRGENHIVVPEDYWDLWVSAYPGVGNWLQYTAESKEWTSGDCTVTLNIDNTMTVSGTGAMADYASTDEVPWKDYSRKVRQVTFEDGVTKIGLNAFADYDIVVDVIINGDIDTWEGSATDFRDETIFHFMKDGQWLKKFPAMIDRPYVMTCGGGITWRYDKEQKTLVFLHEWEGDGVMNDYTRFDDGQPGWFPLREEIDSVNLGLQIAHVGNYAFYNCINLRKIHYSLVGSTDFGEGSFMATSLERFEFPSGITTIPKNMFNMANLGEVVVPEGVVAIGERAFQFCSRLEKLYLPKSLTFIGENAFNRALDDEVDVYVYSANPNGITWTSSATDFGSNTRFHVLQDQAALWKEKNPNALVQFIEDQYTKALPFEMRTADDWRFLCDVVNNGAQNIYAKMMNDIDLGTMNTFVGTKEHPFKGVFDGQGYTLKGDTEKQYDGNNYRAPFRHIDGATIRNLRITGIQRNYQTSGNEWKSTGNGCYARIWGSQWCGGIVGRVVGEGNVIESCTMSGDFRYGNYYNGGIVGEVSPGATLDIRNTLFNGVVQVGQKNYHYDGLFYYDAYYVEHQPNPGKSSPFVGHNNGGTLNISDCFYAGSLVTKGFKNDNVVVGETRSDGKNNINGFYYIFTDEGMTAPEGTTDAREMQAQQLFNELGAMWRMSGDGTTVYPYYVDEYFEGKGTNTEPYLISSEHNWREFIYLSNFYPDYADKTWKQTADITTTKWGAKLIQNSSVPTYDGDGHTLTVDIETAKLFAAPFRLVDNGTIKNLKVKGSVKGALHTAGLLGECMDESYATVYNCAIEADVTFGGSSQSNAHGGGIIGHARTSTTHLYDCIYSGKLTAVDNGISDGTWAGALVGWGEADADVRFDDCYELCELDENVMYADFYWLNNQGPTEHNPAKGASLNKCFHVNCQTEGAAKVTRCGDKDALKDVQGATHTCYPLLGIDLYVIKEGNPALGYLTYGDNTYITDWKGYLFNNVDNTYFINKYIEEGQATDITIYGRTLYKDGSWNTLYLPFRLESFDGTPLQGATVKALTGSSFADGTLTLTFTNKNTIVDGVPYIVKWESGEDIKNPVFKDVTIVNVPGASSFDVVAFKGSYSPVTLAANDRSVLYLGADNKLYYPSADVTIGAFRGYFQLKGLTASDLKAGAKSIVLNFAC